MKIFQHTASERGMWRGWLKDGQVLELHRKRKGWAFGAGVLIHSGDDDRGRRMLCLEFWRFSAYIPLGITRGEYPAMEEPQWSVFGSSEFGLTFHFGHRRKSFDWPWTFDWHRTSYLMQDGTWLHEWREVGEWREVHPYRYVLRSGTVQDVQATITLRETERRRKWLRWTRFGARIERSIDVKFSGEVGEQAGSWKGGTIGCGYTMLPGETPLDTLRRMEKERTF